MKNEIVGRWSVLRPLNDRDFPFVCRMFRDLDTRHLWLEDSRLMTEGMIRDRLTGDLTRYYHTFFVFESLESPNDPIGIFYTYRYSPANGTVFATMAVDKARQQLGCAAEAGLMAYRYLFTNYPLRKVYANVFEFNKESYDFSRSCGFVEEGFMKEHIYYDGRYWGMYTLALYRNAYEKISSAFLKQNV